MFGEPMSRWYLASGDMDAVYMSIEARQGRGYERACGGKGATSGWLHGWHGRVCGCVQGVGQPEERIDQELIRMCNMPGALLRSVYQLVLLRGDRYCEVDFHCGGGESGSYCIGSGLWL